MRQFFSDQTLGLGIHWKKKRCIERFCHLFVHQEKACKSFLFSKMVFIASLYILLRIKKLQCNKTFLGGFFFYVHTYFIFIVHFFSYLCVIRTAVHTAQN